MPDPAPTIQPVYDPLTQLALPAASPSLSVLRQATATAESFTLKHEPMPCPPVPPAPEKLRRGRRLPMVNTLTDLKRFIQHTEAKNPIGFYDQDAVAVVIDYDSAAQVEVVSCSLERDERFTYWQEKCDSEPKGMAEFLRLLRLHRDDLHGSEQQKDALIGVYSSLTGSLVHDADEYLDSQSRAATFTVKRKGKGGAPTEANVEDVPTEFSIRTRILPDDLEETELTVQVRMTGAAGQGIHFSLALVNIEQIERAHIETALQAFAESAGFLCVRGRYEEHKWAEPELPASVVKLLELQTRMIAAQAAGSAMQKAVLSSPC